MKKTHSDILKSVVKIMQDTAGNKLVIQRVTNAPSGNRYVQIMTALGVVTIRDTGALTEPDYPIQDIGSPDNWSKVSKGVIVAKDATDAPFTTAANAARLGDHEIAVAEHLLSVETGLAPVSVICHPGMQVAYAETDSSCVWTYSPSGGTLLTNYTGQWTRNAENCVGIYALLKPWVKAVLYSMPKDAETGFPQKISGVSLGSVGSRVGIHLVSHELSMVIGCTAAVCPKETPSSYSLDGKLKCFVLSPDSTFTKQEEEFEMKANLIDMSALQQPKPQPTAPEVEVVPVAEPAPTPAEVPVPAAEPETAQEPEKPMVYEKPALQSPEVVDNVSAPVEAVIHEETVEVFSIGKYPEEPAEVESADDRLTNLIFKLEEQVKVVRAMVADAKAFRKQYKAESKDSKANAKLTAENAKLKEELAELKSKCSAQEATLNKFKALLG